MPIGCCEKGMISTQANVCARVKLGAALTYDDVASFDKFATVFFNAKAFGL
jgi:hypothetical protein